MEDSTFHASTYPKINAVLSIEKTTCESRFSIRMIGVPGIFGSSLLKNRRSAEYQRFSLFLTLKLRSITFA
eukprot:snap_masked-scaffold_104-processed-gene-0.4-mRNA-1 protein AED:1.00 eAED:1.00 QI:0/0/0/0/1/1/2/0/70